MKKYISLLVILFSPLLSRSQQGEILEYEQYENPTKNVNIILQYTNGKQCKIDNNVFNLHFSDANFTFNYTNFTFNYIMGDDNDKEVIPNIDLSQVKSLYKLDGNYGDVGLIYISFNKNIPLTKITNGKVEQTELAEFPFFFSLNISMQGDGLLKALSDLVFLSKVKKGVLTARQAKDEQENWRKTLQKNTSEGYYKFWRNNSSSIFHEMAYNNLKKVDKSFALDKLNLGTFSLDMPLETVIETIKNRLTDYKTTDKVLKESAKIFTEFVQSADRNGQILLLGEFNNIFLYKHRFTKNYYKIRPLLNYATRSFGNELLEYLPDGFTIGIDHISYVSQKVKSITFWIESGDDSRINGYYIAKKLNDKFGNREIENFIDNYDNFYFSGNVYYSGYGKKSLTFYYKYEWHGSDYDPIDYPLNRAYITIGDNLK